MASSLFSEDPPIGRKSQDTAKNTEKFRKTYRDSPIG
jgi:hypothetical protein